MSTMPGQGHVVPDTNLDTWLLIFNAIKFFPCVTAHVRHYSNKKLHLI